MALCHTAPPSPLPQVIESYLLDKYHGVGPGLLPPTPELRAKAALAARLHDLYIAPIQGCMYKKMGAEQRAEQLHKIAFQLDVLEGLVEGPFLAGGWCGVVVGVAVAGWGATYR